MDKDREKLFTDLLMQNETIVHKVSRFYANDAEEQKDLFQEIVLQLWKAFPNFSGRSKYTTWMYKIALNTAISFRRSRSRKNPEITNWKSHYSLTEKMEKEEQVQILYHCIAALNDVDKAIILLYLDEYKYEEIAELTGLSATNVSTRIHRIKQKIAEAMSEKYKIL